MRTKSKAAQQPLTRLGGPPVGTVAALALGQDQGHTIFVGARAGLFRAALEAGEPPSGWERLANAPVGILALAVSPSFARDQRILVGTTTGLFFSGDAGETWRSAAMPLSETTVTALAFSPNFAEDGVVLAGTLDDGLYYSADRGERFGVRNFGLIDTSVLALAFSPAFAQDQTVFAGTETSAYYSYNGALAWKELSFPADAAPILSLAVSPNFATDNTLYAGTEQAGLLRSNDHGVSWSKLTLPAATINGLSAAPGDAGLLAATEAGVFRSTDGGETWANLLDLPDIVGLAVDPPVRVAGVVNRGVWLAVEGRANGAGGPTWQPLPGLSARSMLGLALAPNFDREPLAYMYGPQEGLWRSTDGGQNWASLEANLSSQDIAAVALSPNFAQNRTLVAAALEGVSVSTDAGDTWTRPADVPADLIAFSPNGKLLVVSFPVAGLRVSVDHGANWLPFPGPWDLGGKVAAIAVSDAGHFYIAFLEGVGETLTLWHGQPKQIEKVLSEPIGRNPLVQFYVPPDGAAERPWYAATGHQVWTLSARAKGRPPTAAAVFDPVEQPGAITALTGATGPNGPVLFACTGRHIYKSADAEAWTKVYDFGQDRAVALALSPTYAADKTAYVLLLGGSMCKLTIA